MNRNILLSFICFISFFLIAAILLDKSNNYFNNLLIYDELILVEISKLSLVMPSYFNQFMVILTIYGREVFWPIVILILFLFGSKEGKKTALAIAITMLLLFPLVSISKEFIDRPRPSVVGLETISTESYSFPSGHATFVSAGAAIALLLFGGTIRRTILSVGLTIEAFLVCFSRIYVGDHYLLDVLGGMLLGVGLSFLVVNFIDPIYKIRFLKFR